MGYRAMGAIGPLHGSTSNLSQRAESIVDRTVTTFVEGGTHQYDAYLFFDYAMKHHGFDMRAFWSTVSSDELAEAGGLSKYVGGGPDGLPYLAFVHAYATARSSASFDTLRSDWPAPPARAASDVPSNGDPLDLAQGENLAHLSSRTFKIAVPQTASTSKRLTVTLTGANVEDWLYKGTDATPFAKLKSGASGQSVGPHGGETIWLHVANTSLAAAGDGTFSLSVRTVDAPSFFWTYLDGIPQPMYSVQSTVISSTNTPNATNPAGTDSSSVTKVTASVTNDYVEVELTSGTITSETVFIPYSSKQTYSNVPGAIDWPTKLADVTGGYTQWQPGPGVPGSYSYLTRALVDIGYKALYDEWATKSKTHVASRLVPKADGFLSPVAANYLVPTGFGSAADSRRRGPRPFPRRIRFRRSRQVARRALELSWRLRHLRVRGRRQALQAAWRQIPVPRRGAGRGRRLDAHRAGVALLRRGQCARPSGRSERRWVRRTGLGGELAARCPRLAVGGPAGSAALPSPATYFFTYP